MMSLGIALTVAAESDPIEDVDSAIEALVPGSAILDHLVAVGVLPSEAREALIRVRLEAAERATPGSVYRRLGERRGCPAGPR